MKMRLELRKAGATVIDAAFEVTDVDSFTRACGELWTRLEKRGLESAPNIGQFMDIAGENVVRQLDGAELRFAKA